MDFQQQHIKENKELVKKTNSDQLNVFQFVDNRNDSLKQSNLLNDIGANNPVQFVHPAFNAINFYRPTIGLEPGQHHPLGPEGQLQRMTGLYGPEIAHELLYTQAEEEDAIPRENIVAQYLDESEDRHTAGAKVLKALKDNPKNNEILKNALNEKHSYSFEAYFGADRWHDEENYVNIFEDQEDIENISGLNRYQKIRILNSSQERIILLAKDLETEQDVVIKVLRKDPMLYDGEDDDDEDVEHSRDRFTNEIDIQHEMSETGIPSLKLHKVIEGKYNMYIVMDLARGGTLDDKIEKGTPLKSSEKALLMKNMAKSLSLLHEKGYAHRDIKPENIFYMGNNPVLGDYGLSEGLDQDPEDINQSVGNPLYAAPEVLHARLGRSSDEFDLKKADTFMLGMVLYQQLAGKMPYPKENLASRMGAMGAEEGEYVKQIHTIEAGEFLDGLDPDVVKLLAKMLHINPDERINIQDLENDEDFLKVVHNLTISKE